MRGRLVSRVAFFNTVPTRAEKLLGETYLVDECLQKSERGQHEGMHREKDIVGANKVVLSIIASPVLLLNVRAVVKGQVEDLFSGSEKG